MPDSYSWVGCCHLLFDSLREKRSGPLTKSSGTACLIYFFKDLFLFLDRGEGREIERGKQQYVVASHMPPNGDLAHNRGMCPDLGIKPETIWFAGGLSIQ